MPCLRLLASSHFCRACLLLYSRPLAAFQLCLCCRDVQASWDGAVYGKHITKGRVPGRSDVLLALNKNFKLPQASGLHSYQPAFKLCFSYLIFYWAFICVYREKNKAVFVNIYGFSQELLPDVISLFLSFC